jgi:hypothetical protein
MSKVKLIEAVSSDMNYQKIKKSDRPGVLTTIHGNIADFKANRNGRVYSRQLWENVLNSDYIKEQLACECLLGEANHPIEDDRMEIDLTKITHAVRNIKINSDGVSADIDILDTPDGKIIDTLVKYGTKIGISSRGIGEIGRNGEVDPNTYNCYTFDLVCRPSVASARLTESEELDKETPMTEEEIAKVIDSYKGLRTPIKENAEQKRSLIEELIIESKNLNK